MVLNQNIQIPKKLLRLIKPKRFKIIIGGRGGAKSESVAGLFAGMVDQSGCRAVCCREYQTSIKQSVHSLISRKTRELDLAGFEILDAMIRHDNGGEIYYQGLARDPQAIKSIDNCELCWVEEGQTLSEKSLEELTPSIRGHESEIWITANLQSSNDPFSLRFFKPFEEKLRRNGYYEDELHTIVWINYYDNPWFPPHLEAERIADKKRMSTAAYEHKWLGEPSDTVDDALIMPDWFDAAIDAHKKLKFEPLGAEIVSHDPSDSKEGDPRSLCYRHGSVILDVQENIELDVNDACDWALDYAINKRADLFVWDGDGLGLSLRRQIRDKLNGKHTEYEVFKGSDGVENPNMLYEPIENEEKKKARKNKEVFKNKKAQYCGYLRDRFFNTYIAVMKNKYTDPENMISISSEIECLQQLRSETCRIPTKPNSNGLLQIMSKEEMLSKFGIKSPNLFDATFMSLVTPQIAQVEEEDLSIPKLKRV